MKKAITILWSIAAIAVVIFIIVIMKAPTDTMRWQVFSICLPLAYVCFLGVVTLSVIDYMKSKKK